VVETKDLLAHAIAGVSLVASVFLAFLGLYIATKFWGAEARIDAIERDVRREREELVGLRVIASMMIRLVNDIYSLSDIERRQIEDLIERTNLINPEAAPVDTELFSARIADKFEGFPRIALYARLISLESSEPEEIIDELILRFPDLDTLSYLEALARVVGEERRRLFLTKATRLRRRIVPIDARAWTG
jgi:hypothetical protein